MKTKYRAYCNVPYLKRDGGIAYCRIKGGRGTDHEGIGPCIEHEAQAHNAAENDRRKSGSIAFNSRREYTLQLAGPLHKKIEALGGKTIYHDPDGRLANLSFEIASVRAVLAQMLEDYDGQQEALKLWHTLYRNGDVEAKPPKIVSLADISGMALDAARVAALAAKVSDLVPLRTVIDVLRQMGVIVMHAVRDDMVKLAIQEQFLAAAEVFNVPTRMGRPGRQKQFRLNEVKISKGSR